MVFKKTNHLTLLLVLLDNLSNLGSLCLYFVYFFPIFGVAINIFICGRGYKINISAFFIERQNLFHRTFERSLYISLDAIGQTFAQALL